VNECPTCCIRKSYWGDVKKACCADQYGAPLMYGAPPMDGLKKDDQGVLPMSWRVVGVEVM
jgi:hypothetical protein